MKLTLTYLLLLLFAFSNGQLKMDSVYTLPQVEKISSTTILRAKLVYSIAPSKNLNDALRENTGIYIKNYGNGQLASIAFRGTSSAQTDILWNGVKLNSPSIGQVDASLFNMGMSDQIQVNGTSQSGGIGGSLNLNNGTNVDSTFVLEAFVTYGSFNTLRTFGKAGFGNGKVFGTTRISYLQSDNDYTFINTYKPGNPKEKLTNAKVQLLHFMQQFSVKVNRNNSLHFNFWLSDAQRQIPPIISKPYSKEAQDDYSIRTSLFWKGNLRKWTTEFTSAFLHDVIHYKNPEIYLSEKSIMQAFRNNFSLTYDSLGKFSINIEAGYDFERAAVPSYQIIRNRHVERISAAVKYEPTKEILVQLKLRESVYDKTFSPFSPALLFRYHKIINQEHYLMFLVSASRNFRFPTLNDLYWVPGGNRNLRTEKSWDGEVTARYNYHNRFTFNATGFCKYITNWIQWINNGTYWEPQNAKRVFTRGAEIYASVQTPSNRDFGFRLSGNYVYTRATSLDALSPFDQSKGKQLIYVPLHLVNASVHFEYKHFYLNAINTFTDAVFIATDNSQNLKGYYLLDFEGGKYFVIKDRCEIGLSFRVNNVTDKQYQNVAQRPMPGRNFEGTIRFKLS
jgi:vitamin B12 transporter